MSAILQRFLNRRLVKAKEAVDLWSPTRRQEQMKQLDPVLQWMVTLSPLAERHEQKMYEAALWRFSFWKQLGAK